jgi:chromosome transmission fidelity protein 1
VREVQRTAFKDARCITLGARKNFCINPDVNSLGSDAAISETCLEMQVAGFTLMIDFI